MRLIDAYELLKAVDKEREYLLARGQTGAEHILVHNFRDLIDNAPTVNDCPNCEYKINYDYFSSSSSYKELQELRKFKKDNERPTGEWIYTNKEDKQKGYGGYCSVCKCDMPIGINDWKQEYYESKFCPNCGAKMKGAEE